VIELAAPITHLLARTFGAYQIKAAHRRQEDDGGDPDFISRRSERQIVVVAMTSPEAISAGWPLC
jgi:hypothetical protein